MQSSNSAFHASLRVGFHPGVRVVLWCAVAVLFAATAANVRGQIVDEWEDATAMGQSSPNTAGTQMAKRIQEDIRKALSYENGLGVEKDPAQAADWFRKAADLGDPAAQNQMGYMYIWGLGVRKDATQAIRWFARAAGSGMQQAKLNMAVLFLHGIGVKRDPGAARAMLEDLADRKNGRALDYLGVIYMRGDGVPRDAVKAEEYFRRSAKGKNPEGEYAMGRLYAFVPNHEQDLRKAAKYLRESAKAGYVPAMYLLGVLLTDHPDLPRDHSDEPLQLLQRAAEAGAWQSSATLGVMARRGRGLQPDAGAAFRWFTIALRQGGATAEAEVRTLLAQCRAVLPRREQTREEQAAQRWLEQHTHADAFVFDGKRRESLMAEIYALPAGASE